MRKIACFIFFMILVAASLHAQLRQYTPANAHAHNDYMQSKPFYQAFDAGFGSIEVDVFLVGEKLFVAHHAREIVAEKTIEALYLEPLKSKLEKGPLYKNSSAKLILLIDLKSDAVSSLEALIAILDGYPTLRDSKQLQFVITGNHPDKNFLREYPSYICFDGKMNVEYTAEELDKIVLFSDNFTTYSKWNGEGEVPAEDMLAIRNAIKKVHASGKPIRFWNAPDNANAWRYLKEWDADFINSDKIQELSSFLRPNQAAK